MEGLQKSEGGQNEVTPEVAPKLGNCERCTVSFFTSSLSLSLRGSILQVSLVSREGVQERGRGGRVRSVAFNVSFEE